MFAVGGGAEGVYGSVDLRIARNGAIELAYELREAAARSDHPPVLAIMGIDLTRRHWNEAFVSGLASERAVVVFDNRGTGDSTREGAAISAAAWEADALAVLDAAGLDRVDLLGYSMGGLIAQRLALHQPRRVRRLLLLSSVIGGPEAINPAPHAFGRLMPERNLDPVAARRRNIHAFVGPSFLAEHAHTLEPLIESSAQTRTSVDVLLQQLAVLRDDVSARLSELNLPVRIVHGDADTLVPFGNAEALARAMPRAEFLRLDGVGHLPSWECPQRLLELATAFYDPD